MDFKFENKNLLKNSSALYQEFRENGIFCDINILTGGRVISAHRIVLAAAIPEFYRMLSVPEITMNNEDPSIIECLVNYCYTGKIEVEREKIETLIFCANHLGLADVKHSCIEFILANLQPNNAIKFKRIAEFINCTNFAVAVDNYICKNFVSVLSSQDFMNLNSNELLGIIARDELKVFNEREVYEAVMKWIKHDQEERLPALPALLREVRFNFLLPFEYYLTVVCRDSLIGQSSECRRVLNEPRNIEPRLYLKPAIYMFCGSNLRSSNILKNTVLKYEDNMWTEVSKVKSVEKLAGGILLNNKIYVIGGKSSMQIYDPETNTWSEGKSMLMAKEDFGIASLDGSIYVIGGSNQKCSSPSVECFSESQNEWKAVAPLSHYRTRLEAISLNGYIYAVGGYTQSCVGKSSGSVDRYCPKENKWTMMNRLKISRCNLGATVLNGKIYACGGSDLGQSLNSCEVSDPETDTWTLIAPMLEKRSNFSLVSSNGKLYAIGGNNGKKNLSSVEEYCPVKNEWQFVASLPDRVSSTVAIATTH